MNSLACLDCGGVRIAVGEAGRPSLCGDCGGVMVTTLTHTRRTPPPAVPVPPERGPSLFDAMRAAANGFEVVENKPGEITLRLPAGVIYGDTKKTS